MARIRARIRLAAVAVLLAGCYMLEHENRAPDMHIHHYADLTACDTMQTFYCRVPGCYKIDTLRLVSGRWRH